MTKQNFRDLQREWDEKLKKAGFEDIEDRNSPREMLKAWHSTMFVHRFDEGKFTARQRYYEMATHFLQSHRFESEVEREVWRLHADGESLRKIASQVSEAGMAISKDGALKIIRSLLKAMKE